MSDCEYDETPPDEWSRGLVGFKPGPVFDVSQTEGVPLPELDTAATGEGEGLVSALPAAAPDLNLDVRIVDSDEWTYGKARGICTSRNPMSLRPLVEVMDRSNEVDLARTLIHEYAHALLHFDVEKVAERARREVKAEAVAYAVCRHFGLDSSNSAFYPAAWQDEEPEDIHQRLERISATVEELIPVVNVDVRSTA